MPEIKLLVNTPRGTYKMPCDIELVKGRFEVTNLPFALKDEVKACMTGVKWLGHTEGRKVWAFDDCPRNRFQLEILKGNNPFHNWDTPVDESLEFKRPVYVHQKLMVCHCMSHHYKILAAEMGVGKSLTYIEVMERAGFHDWWFVSALSGLKAIEREFKVWGAKCRPDLMTYDELRKRHRLWQPGDPIPQGIIYDEFSRCKNSTAKRSLAAKHFADLVRELYGMDGFVIGGSGAVAPKSPLDWWMPTEIICPGWLRERDIRAFEWRMAFFEPLALPQGIVHQNVGWRDDENKCTHCGKYKHEHIDEFGLPKADHEWEPSINEVAYLSKRLEGVRVVLFKKDCLDLPPVTERQIVLPPTAAIKRAARALANAATTPIQALTWLRTLSDGFQYSQKQSDELIKCKVCKGTGVYKQFIPETEDEDGNVKRAEHWTYREEACTCERCGGTGEVPKTIRESKYFKGPKEKALEELLDECEECGRIVVYAGFTASIDLCTQTCLRKGWAVVQVDGKRGWVVYTSDGERKIGVDPLDFWADHDGPVAFVAHPESGGMGLNLVEAYMIVFYSNDFKPENRIQAKNRVDRPGQRRGTVIVDLIHLGTDRKVMETLNENHRLEKMALGEVLGALDQ